ncbi:RHNO1 protein, partial [Rhinopomastus cyanomelas]|nr:RHNO1 protein [Rhinopomastus cyanomelas]
MPRKKKCSPKARKAELTFCERPWEGPDYCYDTLLPLAQNPRRVPTKPVNQSTSAAWVCPQFETTNSVGACQRNRRGLHKPQNRDVSHTLHYAGGANPRATACKYPPLTFENPGEYQVHLSDHPNCSKQEPNNKETAEKAHIQVDSRGNCREAPLLPAPQPVEPEDFSPSDVETVHESPTESCAWPPEEELPVAVDPSRGEEPQMVLVTDTPEHEYGVKVTWRRRPRLMRYLREQG